MARRFKRMFLDIETSPCIVLSWRVGRRIDIDYANIVQERAIICICWKWDGQKRIHSLTWSPSQNDQPMLEQFVPQLREADEIVGHNITRFDLPWIRTRCAKHGLMVPPSLTLVDTLAWARRAFYFQSNRLDYLSDFLEGKHKLQTEFNLWKKVLLKNDRKALGYMMKYCRNDVARLEEVYRILANYMPQQSHIGAYEGRPNYACPHCASEQVIYAKKRVTPMGIIKHQLQCKLCHRYFTVSNKTNDSRISETG